MPGARRAAIGNFWVDLTRCTLYILLPISVIVTLLFVWQGVPQNLSAYVDATTLEGAKQTIAQGPVASQEVIKVLGTNGGGFFNANSAHPYENPTALTNLVQMLLLIGIAAGLTNVLGRMVQDERQGWAIFAVMGILLFIGVMTVYWAESQGNPAFTAFNVDPAPSALQAGATWRARRYASASAPSALFATVTTDAGGAVDAMHDSFLPLGGMVLIVNMALGEVTFGGVGSGLYGMLAFAIVTMFVAGLMVGRTPEYLGKKLEAREVKLTMLALLSYSLSILGCTALAAAVPQGLAGIGNSGPHGFSEILYAFASATGNNGSSFAGLSTNTIFYNMTLAAAMAMGRFIYVIPLLAVAGSLAQKKRRRPVGRIRSDAQPAIRGITGRRRADHGRSRLFPRRLARTRDRAGGDEPRYPLSGSDLRPCARRVVAKLDRGSSDGTGRRRSAEPAAKSLRFVYVRLDAIRSRS